MSANLLNKFVDEGETIYEFGDEFLVECPKCRKQAKVVLAETEKADIFSPRKCVCVNCGYSDIWAKKEIAAGGDFDSYFRLPLWLKISCCGKTLWANNERHLQFLEDYVKAKLRKREPNHNKSLASRLPQWIKSAKNRDEILKAIKKLKERL